MCIRDRFITIACGALSGFHATQSPLMARCVDNEREGRSVFYGAMIAEGFIGLVWATVGMTFYQDVYKRQVYQNSVGSRAQGVQRPSAILFVALNYIIQHRIEISLQTSGEQFPEPAFGPDFRPRIEKKLAPRAGKDFRPHIAAFSHQGDLSLIHILFNRKRFLSDDRQHPPHRRPSVSACSVIRGCMNAA